MAAEYYIQSTKYSIRERETKRGTVYDVVFRIVENGKKKQKVLSGYKTKKAAKEGYTSFVTEHCVLDKGISAVADDPLFETAAERYLSVIPTQMKISSAYEKTHLLRRSIIPYFTGCRLSEITKPVIKRWQDDLWSRTKPNGEPYSYAMKEKERGYLNAFFSWAAEAYGSPNPLSMIKKPRRTDKPKDTQIWTVEQFDMFISAVDSEIYRAFFTVLFWTGRRKGELLALTREDISADLSSVRWRKSVTRKTMDGETYGIQTTKAGKDDTLPICERAKEALRNYEWGEPFIFGGRSPLPQTSIDRAYDKYITLSGVPKIKLHAFRHSFVSILAANGTPIPVVAALISDTIDQVTHTYAHYYATDVEAAVKKLSEM